MVHKGKNNKGKRWMKGQSSSSNPTSRKHRELAKSRFFNTDNKGKGNLTVGALQEHNEILNENTEETLDVDTQSIGGVSVKTFATDWSECSNPCFSRLLKRWNSGSETHKEMLAVLAAVTEVIKAKNGKETETEYFAALMTTLSTVDTPESCAAVVSLLHLTIKRLPKAILKAKFSEISKEFIELLSEPTNAENGLLLRSLIGCLAQLFKAQESAVWSSSSTSHIFQTILHFTVHSRPKVRKQAHHAICSILKGSDIVLNQMSSDSKKKEVHPAASLVAKFCIEVMENSGTKDATNLLHILQLLKELLASFPSQYLKSSCETILKAMTLGTSVVKLCCLQAFHGMFVQSAQSTSLTPQLNAQIINALYDYQPSINDAQPLIAWISVMKEAHLSLNRLDSNLAMAHMSRLFSTAVQCFMSEKFEVHPIISDCLQIVLVECVRPQISNQKESNDKLSSAAVAILKSLENALKYQYHLAWNHVLQLLACFFKIFGKNHYQITGKVLLSLADLRDSYQFRFTSDLDYAVGMAIRSMGPQKFLHFVPLHLESDEVPSDNFARSWLLPVLRDNIQETELTFFVNYFLPMAKSFHDKSQEKKTEGKIAESKTYDILQSQIWSLLPGFCNKLTDLKKSFKSVARLFGTFLNERPDLRIILLSSLRSLIKSSLENDDDKAEMERYAKNYLPIFFNLYTAPIDKKGSVEEGIRLAVYETLKLYLSVSNSQLVESLFEKGLSKLNEQVDNFTRHAILDLLRSMLAYLDKEKVKVLYDICVPYLKDFDVTVQKKAYRCLEDICGSESNGCQQFVQSHLSLIQQTLVQSLSQTNPSSKAPRLRCLFHVVGKIDSSNQEFIEAVIPEVIICTKHGSEKSKRAAFDLVQEIGNTMLKWAHKPANDIIKDFVQLILAGLAGSPQMVSSTILALGTIIHNFKDHVTHDLLDLLIKNMCLLMTSNTREVVKSTLSFVTILFTVLTELKMAQYLETLMEAFGNMTEDASSHFRRKIKEILDRLVRKFGFELIQKLTPERYEKVLKNIRKVQTQKANRRARLDDDDDGKTEKEVSRKSMEDIHDILNDSDSNDDYDGGKPAKSSTWIKESSEIVDFLDPKASKSVSMTNPGKSNMKRSASDFKTSSDGRLIIEDMDETSDKAPINKAKKRKFEEALDDDEDDEGNIPADMQSKSSYQAGGRGIHRKLGKAEQTNIKQNGDNYKAKKAGGDMKKPGKLDPYMYVPLSRQALNKRKAKKYKGHMRNILDGAKRGAEKGMKNRKRQRT